MIPDEEIYRLLCKYNLDHDLDTVEEEDAFKRKFVEIRGSMFEAKNIISIEPFNTYNTKKFAPEYRIIINKDESSMPRLFYANTFFAYDSIHARDNELNLLKDKLQSFNIKFL